MRCPLDGTELKIADRQGVEVDYCPQCRGVWLDRGELDKFLERAGQMAQGYPPNPTNPVYTPAPSNPAYPPQPSRGYASDDDEDYRYRQAPYGQPGSGNQGYPPHKKRKSFLNDFFDFD